MVTWTDDFSTYTVGNNLEDENADYTRHTAGNGTINAIIQAGGGIKLDENGPTILYDYVGASFADNQYSEITLDGGLSGSNYGIAGVRCQDTAGQAYVLRVDDTSLELFRMSTGFWGTQLDIFTGSFSGTSTYRMEATGSDLYGYEDGVLRLQATDATYSGGNPGLGARRTSIKIASWEAGDLSGGAFTLDAEGGSVQVTGGAVDLLRSIALTAEGGSVQVTGGAVDLLRSIALTAEGGSVQVTGGAVLFIGDDAARRRVATEALSKNEPRLIHDGQNSARLATDGQNAVDLALPLGNRT